MRNEEKEKIKSAWETGLVADERILASTTMRKSKKCRKLKVDR
jgi:hypothetical protein